MKPIIYEKDAFPSKGDLVRIRSIAEVKKLYGDVYTYQNSFRGRGFPNHFVKDNEEEDISSGFIPLFEATGLSTIMFNHPYFQWGRSDDNRFKNRQAIVRNTTGCNVAVRVYGNKNVSSASLSLPTEFIEIVEKNYQQNMQKRTEEKRKMRAKEIDYTSIEEEMIAKVDKQKMRRILSACLKIDGRTITGIDEVLSEWARAKRDIYLLFDRQLSISTEAEFELDNHEKGIMFDELQKKFPIEYFFINKMFSFSEEVCQNTVNSGSPGFYYLKKFFPNLQHKMKFTHLAHEVFKENELDIALSEFYNATKINGCITISIDPIEYMLMSLNNSGWTSCHTLHNSDGPNISYGSYSAGIFSYMCDTASIIAFRHKSEESEIIVNRTKIKAFSKNWRQMVYLDIDEKSFICSRQYPNVNKVAEKVVREMIEKLLADKFNLPHVWKLVRDKYNVQRHITNAVLECVEGDGYEEPLHYNDVLNGYDCTMVYNKQLDNSKDVLITIGSYPSCPICGDSKLREHERPMCYYCYKN